MHTGKDDFLCSASKRGLDIREHGRGRPAAPRTPRDPRDTERAVVVTPILHLDECPRPVMYAGQRLSRKRLQVKFQLRSAKHGRDQPVFLGIRNDVVHMRQESRGGRLERGPTAGDHDPGIAKTRDPADRSPGIGRGLGRDRAGVDDRQVGQLSFRNNLMPGRSELAGSGLDLRLIQPATNRVEEYLHSNECERVPDSRAGMDPADERALGLEGRKVIEDDIHAGLIERARQEPDVTMAQRRVLDLR